MQIASNPVDEGVNNGSRWNREARTCLFYYGNPDFNCISIGLIVKYKFSLQMTHDERGKIVSN